MLLPLCACTGGFSSGGPNQGAANPGKPRDNTPVVVQVEQPGTEVAANEYGIIDYSNANKGYICAQSLVEGRYKVLVKAPDGMEYHYTIESTAAYITIQLSRGNGLYTARLLQHVREDRYAVMIVVEFEVELADSLLPFLYPNQYVDFAVDDQTVQLSQEVTEGATSEIEAINAIYMWVVMNLSYDYQKASTVQPGYLPNNDDTIEKLTGICFDYAVLCASMLRAQRIPARLEIGYCSDVYHAWISVFSSEQGVIRIQISLDVETWTMLDPTIDSSGKTPLGLGPLMINEDNYYPMFYY